MRDKSLPTTIPTIRNIQILMLWPVPETFEGILPELDFTGREFDDAYIKPLSVDLAHVSSL